MPQTIAQKPDWLVKESYAPSVRSAEPVRLNLFFVFAKCRMVKRLARGKDEDRTPHGGRQRVKLQVRFAGDHES